MEITVRLFDTLRKFAPIWHKNGEFRLSLTRGATLRDVLQACGLSEDKVTVAMVNGMISHLNFTLEEQDEVSLFPSVGGSMA